MCLKVILTTEHYMKLLTIFIWKFAIFWSWQLALENLGQLAPGSFFYLQQAHGHMFEIFMLLTMLSYDKMLFKQKNAWFFRSRKTEFSRAFLSAINLEPFQSVKYMSELQESMVQSSILGLGIFKMAPYPQNFCKYIHDFLNRKLWSYGENTRSKKVLKITQRMHLKFFNCFREIFLFFVNGKFLHDPKIVQNASKKLSCILWLILKTL